MDLIRGSGFVAVAMCADWLVFLLQEQNTKKTRIKLHEKVYYCISVYRVEIFLSHARCATSVRKRVPFCFRFLYLPTQNCRIDSFKDTTLIIIAR